jgi:hypothetical protein
MTKIYGAIMFGLELESLEGRPIIRAEGERR